MTGRLPQRTYELKDGGGKRTVLEVEADDVAASLKFASAKITKAERSRPAETRTAGSQPAEADPLAADAPAATATNRPSRPKTRQRPLWPGEPGQVPFRPSGG